MDTLSRHGVRSQVSIPRKTKKVVKEEQIVRMQLRYEELDAEFLRENRRLNRMMRQLKKGLNKKIF